MTLGRPAGVGNPIAGSGLDPAFACFASLLFPKRGVGLELVDQKFAGAEGRPPMAGGDGDEDDGILRFQNPDAVQNADGVDGPAAGRLLGDDPEGLLGHAGVMFQSQAADLIAFVEVTHQA